MKQFDFMKDPDASGADSITVEHAPKRKLNLFPRLVCLFTALVIWIYMVNVNDPDMTETMTLTIELKGVETLEEAGMMVYGLSERTVTVTVKGTNRDLKQFTEADYKATVEVGGINEVKDNIQLPINIIVPENSNISLEQPPANLIAFSDKKVTKPISTIFVTFGAEYDKEFEGKVYPDTIEITGPQKIIDKIAMMELKAEGKLSNGAEITTVTAVKYLDKDGVEINTMDSVSIVTEGVVILVQSVESDMVTEAE